MIPLMKSASRAGSYVEGRTGAHPQSAPISSEQKSSGGATLECRSPHRIYHLKHYAGQDHFVVIFRESTKIAASYIPLEALV